MSDPLEAFGALVESHLRAILETAHAAPPGGGHAWDSVLAHYGVTGDAPDARIREVEARGLTGGAVPSEVSRALAAMTERASTELARIVALDDPRRAAFVTWLAEIGPRESARYSERVGTSVGAARPSASSGAKKVASVFANAARSSKEVPWSNAKSEASVVLACPACGAPQERALDFQCRYCHSRMGA